MGQTCDREVREGLTATLRPDQSRPSAGPSPRAGFVFLRPLTRCYLSLMDIACTRCGQTRAGFARPPFPGALGARATREICQDCWGQWLKQQTMLINHYGLNVMDPQARSFLTKNLEAFLFKAGHGEDVDTTKQGTINW